MRIEVIRSELGGAYLLGSERIKTKDIGNLIREGHEISVIDPDGFDFTQETLVKVAFEDVFPPNIKNEYVNVMAEFLDKSDLLLVIENGGYNAFVQRRGRQALFEGSYYFDKIDDLIKKYMSLGKNKQEMLNYLDNLISGVI